MSASATFRLVFPVALLLNLTTGYAIDTTEHMKCIEVVDGDTLLIETANGVFEVDLWGIDAPELGQSWGPEAMQLLHDMALNQVVTLEEVDGAQNPPDARVFVAGQDAAAVLVDQGLAWLPDDGNTSDDYARLTIIARGSKRGIWADAERLHPARWREQNRARQQATPTPTPRPVSLSDIADDIEIAGGQGTAGEKQPVAISNQTVQPKRIILPDTEYGRCINTVVRLLVPTAETVRTGIAGMKIPENPKRRDALRTACSQIKSLADDLRHCPDEEAGWHLNSGEYALDSAARKYKSACDQIFRENDPGAAWKSLTKGDTYVEEARIKFEEGLAQKREYEERHQRYDRY